jgi:hypothetical protein
MLVVVVISPTKIVPCDDVWVELSICVLWTEYIYHPYMDRHTAYITMAARTPAWCSMHVLPVTASRAACPGGNGGARRAEPDRAARGNGHPSMPFRYGRDGRGFLATGFLQAPALDTPVAPCFAITWYTVASFHGVGRSCFSAGIASQSTTW